MANTYVNKIIINGETKIDLTGDTAVQSKVLTGYTFHDKTGAPVTGSCTFDSDTSSDTATASEILAGSTAHARGGLITGDMANNGSVSGVISTKSQQYTVPMGYHDGGGKVQISSTEQAKIIAGNIKSGISILGVTGTYSGASATAEAKTATPTFTTQTILPTSADYLSQVTINPIPVSYADNAAGGRTCTVG